jgi:hypothetical protein
MSYTRQPVRIKNYLKTLQQAAGNPDDPSNSLGDDPNLIAPCATGVLQISSIRKS